MGSTARGRGEGKQRDVKVSGCKEVKYVEESCCCCCASSHIVCTHTHIRRADVVVGAAVYAFLRLQIDK